MYLPNGKFVNITFRFYDGVSHEQRLYTFIFILFESGACQLKESIVMARHAAHQASITVAPRGELQFWIHIEQNFHLFIFLVWVFFFVP